MPTLLPLVGDFFFLNWKKHLCEFLVSGFNWADCVCIPHPSPCRVISIRVLNQEMRIHEFDSKTDSHTRRSYLSPGNVLIDEQFKVKFGASTSAFNCSYSLSLSLSRLL